MIVATWSLEGKKPPQTRRKLQPKQPGPHLGSRNMLQHFWPPKLKVKSCEAHGVAWEYAGFSLDREEYLDEMWEQYKKDGC